MADRLPPLTALRAFEAAARHLSFARAAEELSVTPAALSYQIKNLEAHLGAPLFRRLNRAVALTDAGLALLPGTSDGFDALRRAWTASRRLTDTGRLTITAGPAFTAKWLAPRLFRFATAHPEIELRFIASLKLMDFDRDDIDVAIRFGTGSDEGLYSERLMSEWVTPMMRPSVAANINSAADLLDQPLIHDDSMAFIDGAPDWKNWFAAMGVTAEVPRGPHFSQADHAMDLALAGEGVLLGRTMLAAKYLSEGVLVAPFDLALGTDAAFRLVCPLGREDQTNIAVFRAWVQTEIAEDIEMLKKKRLPGAQ